MLFRNFARECVRFFTDGTSPRWGSGPCRAPLPLPNPGQAEEPPPVRDPGRAQRPKKAAPRTQATRALREGGSACIPSAGSRGGQLPSSLGSPCGVKHPRRGQRDSAPTGGSSSDSWGCRLNPPEQGGAGGAYWRSSPPPTAQEVASPPQKGGARDGTGPYLLSSSSASPGLSKGSCPSAVTSGLETAAAILNRGRFRAP